MRWDRTNLVVITLVATISAFAADNGKAEVKGMIISRTGESRHVAPRHSYCSFHCAGLAQILAFATDLRPNNLPRYDDFDAAILLSTFGCVVVGNRIIHAHPLGR
jgi:hypothetical protein